MSVPIMIDAAPAHARGVLFVVFDKLTSEIIAQRQSDNTRFITVTPFNDTFGEIMELLVSGLRKVILYNYTGL